MADIANVLMVADRMLEMMASAATKESAKSWGVANELETLEKIISDIKDVLIDAERLHGALNGRMKGLLWRVERAVNEADDVLDEFVAVALGRRLMSENKIAKKVRSFFSLSSSKPLVYRIKMIYEMKKVRTALDDALFWAKELHELRKARYETCPIFVREGDVIGRDFDKGKIMKLVLEAANTETGQETIRVVSVVGVPGIGKTTLAQLIYNDAVVAAEFDLRMWVYISDLVDTELIVHKLIRTAKDEKVDYLRRNQLQRELQKTINGKRFFLVLDDVSNEYQGNWPSLRNLLMGGAKGSIVLVTTRSEKVAKIMRTVSQSYRLGPLNDADSFFLLQAMALSINEDQNSIQAFREIGRQIAGKCKGVPFVIQNVGSSMAYKSVDKWQSFLHEEKTGNKFRLGRARQGTRPIFVRAEDIIGRDSDKEEIMKLVLKEAADTESTEQKLTRVVSVVGAEGIGKTTLAQLVFNDAAVASHFNLKMWVYVSDYVDMRLIVQKLIESAGGEKFRDDNLQIDRLQEQLREALNGKRFFLVLDDVRYGLKAKWMSLRNLLMAGENGSTVLVTTCSKKIAKITCTFSQPYHLGRLNNEDSLFLLESMALGISADRERDRAFQEIGRKIARKCNGVPLVIRTIGSSMACTSVDKWQSFLRQEPGEEIIGRDADKEAIMKRLFGHNNSGENELVISVCGIAGIGKTTLAQLIFKNSKVQDHFDLRIWVPVTDFFDLKVVMQKIVLSLTTTDPRQLQVKELESLIHQEIHGKRCLLVLDDVRNVESGEWLLLRSLLSVGANGTRVIVTTWSEEVAFATAGEKQTHKLKSLDEVSCWSLFLQVAFEKGQDPTNSKIIKIGKEIVAKCQGIPLIIRKIGGILYFKNTKTEWQSFYENELPKMLNGADIGDSHNLIYEHLPYFLKPCFAYCALFPEDYEIDVKTLINLWISQGFIRADSGLNREAVGYKYFVELLRRSFFQETMRDELGYITKCKMQNFKCTNLAKNVAQDVCATLGWQGGINSTNPRHVALDFHLDSSWHIRSLAQSKTIRSLILPRQLRREVEGRSSEPVCNEIKKFKCLRSLDLHNSGIKVVADTIGDLKFLRYLDLSQNSSIKALPNSIGRLWNLQSLKLNHCSNLQKLPKAIKNLVNLRNLENDCCYGLTSMPRGLGKLTNLQTLSEFVLSNGTGSVSSMSGKLNELEELNELRGKLKIKNLRCLGGDDSTRAKLIEKTNLVSLVLIWDFDAAITGTDCKNLLKDLRPHHGLRELSLSAYGGVRFSNWLTKLGNLVKFSLSRCIKCQCLPPIGHLQHLEVLLVDELPELEYISEDKSGPFFQSLKELRLRNLPKLVRWWKHEASVEGPTFPRLSKLIIKDCPNLTSMPLFPCLEELLVLKNTRWEPFQETIASVTSSTDVTPVVSLSNLRSLCITNMPKGDPKVWQSLSSLRSLTFDHLKDIETFLEGIEQLTKLQELHIWRCALKEISWIRNIKSLRILSLKLCPDLTIPHDQISLVTFLQKVEIQECPKISHIERMLKDRLYNLEITNSKSTASSGIAAHFLCLAEQNKLKKRDHAKSENPRGYR